ncbi:hypothetical protein ACNKHN_24090 [Shigella flexneri]
MGSLVADFHRNLLKGGISILPKHRQPPDGESSVYCMVQPDGVVARNKRAVKRAMAKSVLEMIPETLPPAPFVLCRQRPYG